MTRGDLEPVRGNLHICKFLGDFTYIQIRMVTAERFGFVLSALPDEHVTTQGRKERRKARTGRRKRKTAGMREREKAREKEQLTRERERALDSIRPETNNSVLS